MTIEKLLALEEGFSGTPYIDSLGYPTIGIGTLIGPKGASLSMYQFSITKKIAELMMVNEIDMVEQKLDKKFDWFKTLNPDRKSVVVSMCYQLGFDGFCKFKQTIRYIAAKDFYDAADEMLDSLWHKQTPGRALRHSQAMKYGELSAVPYYSDLY